MPVTTNKTKYRSSPSSNTMQNFKTSTQKKHAPDTKSKHALYTGQQSAIPEPENCIIDKAALMHSATVLAKFYKKKMGKNDKEM